MNEILRQALFGIAVPLPIAAAFAWAGCRLVRRERFDQAGVLFTLAVAVPMPIAFALVNGSPSESWERLLWMSLVGGLVMLVLLPRKVGLCNTGVGAVVLAASVTLVLWRAVKPEDSWLIRLAPGLGAAILFTGLSVLAKGLPGAVLGMCLWAAAVATGLGVVLMGQMSMGAAVAPVGAAVLVLAIAAGRSERGGVFTPGVLAAASAPLAGATAVAWMWMKVTGSSYGLWLPMLAPFSVFAGAVVLLPMMRKAKEPVRLVLATVAVLAVGLAAVGGMLLLDSRAETDDGMGGLPDFMQYPDE
jgi:hypothetical protein